MGVLGALHGLAVCSPRAATVVELGARDGAQLVALAAAWPGARYFGVEPDPARVAAARARAERLGLQARVSFVAADPAEAELPESHYLIVHDVVSHLDASGRHALLSHIRAHLAPGGVALVSFDVRPGVDELAPLRALMRFHVAHVSDDRAALRQARDIAAWQAARVERVHGPERGVLARRGLAWVESLGDGALLRLLRETSYSPLSLGDFARELAAAGLQWLTNARTSEPRTSMLEGRLRELASVGDTLQRQQYLDYFLMTRERTSLVCRDDERVVRAASPEDLLRFLVAARPDAPPPPAPLSAHATLLGRLLADHAPAAVPAVGLCMRAIGVSRRDALVALGELWRAEAVELSLAPPAPAWTAPPAPRTGDLQRAAALDGTVVPSLWMRTFALGPLERSAVLRMDGTMRAAGYEPETLAALVRKGFVLRDG